MKTCKTNGGTPMTLYRSALGLVLALALSPVLFARETAAPDSWRYVVPAAGEAFANPTPVAIALHEKKPGALEEVVRYRGSQRRYAHLVYGRGKDAGVAIVVDQVGPDQLDLYVDANRDGKITDRDRVAGEGPSWRAALAAAVNEGDALREFPRTVLFRYGRVSRTLAVATCGYLEGPARLDGHAVAVRRVDGDANGLFGDSRDLVWVDANGDGQWDRAEEAHLFAPILRLGNRRITLRADAYGKRLALAALEGSGKLRLALPRALRSDQVEEIQVTVQSRDGVTANLRGLDTEAVLPAGEYRISSFLLTLKDPAGGPIWGYVFTDNGGKDPRWHVLARDKSLALDPVGTLDFSAGVPDGKTSCRAGDAVQIKPVLYTGDGLLIERAYRGSFETSPFGSNGGCHGKISLLGGGRLLDSATTGFA
jgi:hypothetical protein